MRTRGIVFFGFVAIAGAPLLLWGCSKKETQAAAPAASASAPSASASASASAAPSDSVAPLASEAPSAVPNVPTEDQFEQKAQASISSTAAAEAELKKLEKEIGQ
jgi:hypothetical protein